MEKLIQYLTAHVDRIVWPLILVMSPVFLYGMSRIGWKALAAIYSSDRPFEGVRIGQISMSVNWADYTNCIVLKCNAAGMYLQPVLLVRLFHPALFIPWTAVAEISERKRNFSTRQRIIIGTPAVATLQFSDEVFSRFRHFIPEGIGGSLHSWPADRF